MTATLFADAVRTLAAAARDAGRLVPSFRSPPSVPGRATRTLRRRPDGSVQVSVVMGERPWAAVRADLVDGVVAANGLAGQDAEGLRRTLWAALERAAGRDPAGAAA